MTGLFLSFFTMLIVLTAAGRAVSYPSYGAPNGTADNDSQNNIDNDIAHDDLFKSTEVSRA